MPHLRGLRPLLTGLFATALLLSGASVALPAAYAVDNVTITGTVVDPGGDPVAD
ncbi:MAG: hypothetical protein JWR90_278, partial [Marmoricola sp.]|nr:hypothetical protein [Marmoricola sp.]